MLPAELRDDMNLAAMEISGIDCAVKRFTSIEYQNLLNQENNKAFFIQHIEIGASRKRLAKNLEHYSQQLDGSR